jgi:putative ABC transport system ATP-binding protein
VEVVEILRQAGRTSGRALIVATHDTRIFRYADRVARMEDGKIVAVTRPDGPGGEA